jgi:hypothetical protein
MAKRVCDIANVHHIAEGEAPQLDGIQDGLRKRRRKLALQIGCN